MGAQTRLSAFSKKWKLARAPRPEQETLGNKKVTTYKEPERKRDKCILRKAQGEREREQEDDGRMRSSLKKA